MKNTKLKLSKVVYAFMALLVIQFVLLSIANLFFIPYNLDCDSAKLMNHIIKMWDHRTLAIPDWNYSTTLEWDCTSIFAIPIYAVTHNIYLSCGISNIILTILFLIIIYSIVRDEMIFLVSANIILIPFSTGMLDYYNMMFFGGSQYLVKVMVPLLLVSILLFLESDRKTTHFERFLVVLYFLLLLDTAMSSGIYVFAAGIAAIAMGYIIYKVLNVERISLKVIAIFSATIVLYVVGMIINQKVLGGTRGESMTLCPVFQIQANILSNFFGFFELFDGLTTEWYVKVISPQGVLTILKFLFAVLLIIESVSSLLKICKRKCSLLRTLFTIMFFWTVLIMFTVKTQAGSATSEYRYYLVGTIPMIIVLAKDVIEYYRTEKEILRQKIVSYAFCAIVAFLSFSSYYVFLTKEDTAADLKEVVEYCKNADCDIVYMYEGSNDSDIMKVLDRDKEYICLLETGRTYAFDYYERYVLGGVDKANSIVLVNEEEFDFEDEFYILDMKLKKIDEVNNRAVYRFAN